MTPRLFPRNKAGAALRRRTSMLHPECPVEQALHSGDPAVQAQLAQEIWRRDAFIGEGVMLVAEPKRLRVLARSEGALRAPVEALRARYGAALVVEPPTVRYAYGTPVLEPYMVLLLCGPARYLPLVQPDLERRRAHVKCVDHHAGPFVLEAEAPLANLLGYREWADALMEGDAEVSMWLSRYRPIDDGPRAA